MPYYKKKSDFDNSKIISSLSTIFSCVNLIYHVELLGGEPFLNKNLPLIAKHLLDSGKILHIDIITNGTILPSKRELCSLKNDIISVVIDDYGILSKKMNSLSNALVRYGIDFRINKHWAWADLGGFQSRIRCEEQLADIFGKCNFNSCFELLDGKLYRCPRSSHGTNIGLIPKYSEDFIDIQDFSLGKDIFIQRLRAFIYDKKFIHACNHCNGNSDASLTLTPAKQQT
jgi:hypothetical protein